MNQPIIKVENFTKSYGSTPVIEDISFEIQKGEIFGLLGTNGAGKTTTLECIEGLRSYQSGTIQVNGKLGVQLQSTSLPKEIKPIEAIQMFSLWNKTTPNPDHLHTFGIDQIKDLQYHQLSTGQKRRLHLAIALIGDPDIIFLDEPSAGLDVEARASLHDVIRSLKQQGKTLIMASHDMAEVESLCDRIAILDQNHIAFIGTAAQLTSSVSALYNIHIKTDPILPTNFTFSEFEQHKQDYAIFTTKDISQGLIELLQYANQNNHTVQDIKIEHATLEQRFIEIAREVK